MRFTKMQGIGNDYVYVSLFSETVEDAPALARRVSERRFGVGSDGLILIGPSEKADFRMTMYNADGSRSAMCGNGARCVGKYVYDKGLTQSTEITLETDAGIKALRLIPEGGHIARVCVDMGEPALRFGDVPCTAGRGRTHPIRLKADGREFEATPVGMGNPHAVIFTEAEIQTEELARLGALLERHPAFPERTNVEFVQVLGRRALRMRVWERGSGITMACGTGACASLAAAVLAGHTDRHVSVRLDGGTLDIEWDTRTGHILMTGPAAFVFDGELIDE